MKYLHIICCLLSFLLFQRDLFSEQKLPDLKKGMTFLEVVKLWGSPEDKVEKEAKRKDIWTYKNNTRVFFDNGHVATVLNQKGVDMLSPEMALATEKSEMKLKNNKPSVTPVADQDVVDDILSEIMKDPSNAEPSSGGPPQQPNMPPPNVINQIPPPEVIN
jgi:hypothetical protein